MSPLYRSLPALGQRLLLLPILLLTIGFGELTAGVAPGTFNDLTDGALNSPPVLDTIGDIRVYENSPLAITLSADDSDASDTLVFSVTPALPGFVTLADNGDRTATLRITAGAGQAGLYGPFVFEVSDGGLSMSDTISIEVETAPTPCPQFSSLDCDDIAVSLPFDLSFDSRAGGIVDTNGVGTGFTIVVPPNFNEFPATPANPALPGHEPTLLEVNGGKLHLTTTKGSITGQRSTSRPNNNQVNMLGAAFEAPGSVFNITAELDQPQFEQNAATFGPHAGVWYGFNDDNFVRVVVEKNSSTTQRLRLRYEYSDPDNVNKVVSEEIVSGAFNSVNPERLWLRLEIDPVYKSVSAYYAFNGGSEAKVTSGFADSLIVPDLFFEGVGPNEGAPTGPVTFAGILGSHSTAPVNDALNLSFRSFGIDVPAVVPALLLSKNDVAISVAEGYVPDTFTIDLFTNNGTLPNVVMEDALGAASWLIAPANATVGPLDFSIAPNLAPGSYNTQVTFSAVGYDTIVLNVSLLVSAQANIPKVLGSTPSNGEQNVSLSTSLSANNLFFPNDVNGIFGVDNTTITNNTVKLFRVSDNLEIPATVNGTGGGDGINLTPNISLEVNTTYRFQIDGVTDLAGILLLKTSRRSSLPPATTAIRPVRWITYRSPTPEA